MQEKTIDFYRKWFDRYVEDHLCRAGDGAPMLERKHRHTMRVFGHARAIIRECEACAAIAQPIEIATLLHDVGRFPQLLDTGTYDDRTGYDHGEAGARILAEVGVLDGLGAEVRGLVLATVKYHNRGVLPGNLLPETRLALSVVRDADKLDAIRNNLKYLYPDKPHGKSLKCGLTWDDNEVSPEVVKLAFERQLIPFKSIRWSNDFILFLCCWIYDMGFSYAFEHLKASGHFEALLDRLPDSGPFSELKAQLRDDLDWIAARSRG